MNSTKNSERLLDTLSRCLNAYSVTREDTIGVAYSAGRDSSVLLWALSQIHPREKICAIHVDHGLRSSSEREAEKTLASDQCRRWGISIVFRGPPLPGGAKNGEGPEAAARAFRYSVFAEVAAEKAVKFVLTAHHAGDQAETIFMRLMRGGSWGGLAGIPRHNGLYLRPFLDVPSKILVDVSEEQDIVFWNDSTNLQGRYLRNFIRNEVFPLLQSRFRRMQGALLDFGVVWKVRQIAAILDSAWKIDEKQAGISLAIWEQWSSEQRQGQLLLLLRKWKVAKTISRRFLRPFGQHRLTTGVWGEGHGWRLFCTKNEVIWERVVQRPSFQYFVKTSAQKWYILPDYSFYLSESLENSDDLFLPGVDPQEGVVWRTARPGERFAVADGAILGKTWHNRVKSGDHQGNLVYVYQKGLLRAVIDPVAKKRLWPAERGTKLNIPGIFVKLVQRRFA